MARTTDFVTLYRQFVTSLLNTQDDLEALRKEYDSLDYGNTIPQEDFDANGITKAHFTSAVASIEAITSLLAQGHRTNLYRLRL